MADLSLEQYDAYVGMIYSAAMQPGRWKQFLSLLSQSFNSARVAFHCYDYASDESVGTLAEGFDPGFLASYGRHYAALSPYSDQQAQGPVGVVTGSRQLVDRDLFLETEFYHEWIRPQEDIAAGAGITVWRDLGRFLRLGCNIRLQDEERLQPMLEETLERLAPHLRRAFTIGRRLGGEATAGLDDVPSAVYLVDSRARIRHLNPAGEKMLRAQEFVVGRNDRLAFLDRPADRAFQTAVHSIAMSDFVSLGGDMIANSPTSGRTAAVTVAPFMSEPVVDGDIFQWKEDGVPRAIVCVHELPGRELDRSQLAKRYGLTAAEAALAEAMLQGQTLMQFAQVRGVSIHTARTQLKAVFEKTGVSQQSQLVALLATVAPRRPTPAR